MAVTRRVRGAQGNNFTYTCTAQNSYIQDLCPAAGAAAAPSGGAASPLLPMGTGSASAGGASGAPAGQATPLFPGAPCTRVVRSDELGVTADGGGSSACGAARGHMQRRNGRSELACRCAASAGISCVPELEGIQRAWIAHGSALPAAPGWAAVQFVVLTPKCVANVFRQHKDLIADVLSTSCRSYAME